MVILVLNFGGQFTHLIARRLRDSGVFAEILPCDTPIEKILSLKPSGIVLSGGPSSVYEKDAPNCDPAVFKSKIPVLGICYGQQLMAHVLGGSVTPGTQKEFGKREMDATGGLLFQGITGKQSVWFSHADHVDKVPPGFTVTASTDTCAVAAMEDNGAKLFAVQFHPEVAHTPNGRWILENFAFKACGEKGDWHATDQLLSLKSELKEKIGDSGVIIGISGGVDSLVAATLLQETIGNQLHCVFIDTGLLRKGEVEEVFGYLGKRGFLNLQVIDAQNEFLSKLTGVLDPEEKRKIIGHTFIEVFQKAALEIGSKHEVKFLAQGTIYPDRIESAQPTRFASKIKSHHNLTLPEGMSLKVVEPLKEFYKDEVRALGEKLGIPKELVWRHPFPGPGLAIRILGEITAERLSILREADAIFIQELRASGWYDKTWQAFAALLPVKSVGVMGDSRTYEYVISLRAVNSVDGMTADWVRLPPELLEKISSRIVNDVRGANRVLYDITQKPPGTIEYL